MMVQSAKQKKRQKKIKTLIQQILNPKKITKKKNLNQELGLGFKKSNPILVRFSLRNHTLGLTLGKKKFETKCPLWKKSTPPPPSPPMPLMHFSSS